MLQKVLIAVLLSMVVLLPAQAQVPDGIEVSVSLPKSKFSSNDPLSVVVSYTNVTPSPLKMLKWGTALEGWISTDIVKVTKGGATLPYTGPLVKRRAPQESDFITILPRQTVSGVVDLSKGYPIEQKGLYALSPQERPNRRFWRDNPFAAKRAPIEMELLESRAESKALPPSFSSCSFGAQSVLNNALIEAERISLIAATDLANAPVELRPSAERYRRWFGAYSAARYNRVASNFNRIYSAARNQRVEFDCACLDVPSNIRPFVLAYVFINRAYEINICPAFFGLNLAGTDSQSGTIVHELSHFSVVAATNNNPAYPEVYGTPNALALARNNPTHAINNAENHEYFAENTPAFSMPVATPESKFSPGVLLLLLGD